jgi:hypothetical protein
MAKDKPVLESWQSEAEEEAHRVERKRLSENYFNRAHTLAAWLLATLVAVNGGAVIAIVSRQALPTGAYRPAMVFVVGLVLALASGLLSWWEAQDRSGLYYIESLRPDRRTIWASKRMHRLQRRVSFLRKAARFANYASLFVFVAGCGWAAATYR